MFRKTLLALMIMVGFAVSPQKAQASVPIGEILEGAKAAKEVYDVAQPMLVSCGKAVKNGCKKIAKYIRDRRGRRNEDVYVYVNPLRTAAIDNKEEFEVVIRRRHRSGHDDIDGEHI